MAIDDIDRRTLLRLGGVAAIGALAGCNSQQGSEATSTATTTPTSTATATATATEASGTNPPGADQLGGPDDLQSSATVEATMLSSDQGAGQHVNTPAVVWVEQGATVTWNIAEGSHSITAYHPDFDRSLRIPEGVTPFDSGILSAGESFEHTFDTPGVYNYFCRPHEGLGMVGVVIVGAPAGGPGWWPTSWTRWPAVVRCFGWNRGVWPFAAIERNGGLDAAGGLRCSLGGFDPAGHHREQARSYNDSAHVGRFCAVRGDG